MHDLTRQHSLYSAPPLPSSVYQVPRCVLLRCPRCRGDVLTRWVASGSQVNRLRSFLFSGCLTAQAKPTVGSEVRQSWIILVLTTCLDCYFSDQQQSGATLAVVNIHLTSDVVQQLHRLAMTDIGTRISVLQSSKVEFTWLFSPRHLSISMFNIMSQCRIGTPLRYKPFEEI